MKKYIFFVIALFSVVMPIFPRAQAAGYWISVELLGCSMRPYPGQEIKIQRAAITGATASSWKISWTDILTKKTGPDGKIYLLDAEKTSIDLGKHTYRAYWEKSKWINSYTTLRSGKRDYQVGYVESVDCCTKPARTLGQRIALASIDEKKWSEQHYRNLLDQADKINDPEIFKQRILNNFKIWHDPNKKRIEEFLNDYSLVVLRRWWVNIQSEIDNSQKYRRTKNDYAYWCTGFASYVIAKAGGPVLKMPTNVRATAFIDYFKQPGFVLGQDKQNYRRTYISREEMFKQFASNPFNIPAKSGSFTLIRTDKRIDLGSGGHVMVNVHTNKFPLLTVISGNMGWIVKTKETDLHKFDDFHNWFVTLYVGAGQFECRQ